MAERILILDDEPAIVVSTSRYLRSHGFEVHSASELEEAEALLANLSYALVIADLRLTGVHGAEGLEVVAYVREHCPWTRTILLTAYGSPELERVARDRGVDAVLHKPLPLPDLAQAVFALVGGPR